MELLGGASPHPPAPLSRGAGSSCRVLALPPGRAWCHVPSGGHPGGECLTWGPGGPRSPGRPGFPASPYEGHGVGGTSPGQAAPAHLGGLQGHQAPEGRGKPHVGATYVISVLARGAGRTAGTHGTLGEMQGRDEGAVGDTVPCHPGWAVPAAGSPIPRMLAEMPRSRNSVAVARGGNGQPCPHPHGPSGWGRRCQDSQKHQALRVHRGDLGNLEDPAGWGQKRKKSG